MACLVPELGSIIVILPSPISVSMCCSEMGASLVAVSKGHWRDNSIANYVLQKRFFDDNNDNDPLKAFTLVSSPSSLANET